MNKISIYLSTDVENFISHHLIKLGYTPITGEKNFEQLLENGIQLVIMGTDSNNMEFARRMKKELWVDILLLDTNTPNTMNSTDLIELNPLGLLSAPLTFDEVKININRIVSTLKSIYNHNEQEMWFKGVLHTTKDAVIAIDHMGSIKLMNPVAQHLVGIEEEKAIGMFAERVIQFRTSENYKFSIKDDHNTESEVFEGEIYNRVTKVFIHVTGNITTIKNSLGEFKGKVLTLKDVGEIKALFSRINYQSSHDHLTGILNRKSFIDYADQLITLSKYDNSTHGLLVISLDKFRVINDTCGHIAGDELLRKIAYMLNEIDRDNEYIKGRIGGDEFGILLKNSSISKVKHFSSTIKRKISNQDFIWGEKEYPIMCSYGIVAINKSTEDHYTLFAAVDDACAISKEKGGGRIEIYNGVDEEYNKRRGEMMWIHKLKEAITNDQFILYYQDIESVKADDVKKVEILVRLKDGQGNIISPTDFIPPAERYGIMPEIDKIIIEKSASYCKKIIDNKNIKENYILCVNISATSLLDKSLPNYIQTIFKKYKVPPTLFCFEITETTTIKNMKLAQQFIKSLKSIGCTFSLDDFGSGFSNFTYLKDMDVDNLKIDGSFISDMMEEPINRAMVESINNIGHIMKMKTVAEFVKNDEIKQALKDIGVDYLQGFAISKPTPIENLLI